MARGALEAGATVVTVTERRRARGRCPRVVHCPVPAGPDAARRARCARRPAVRHAVPHGARARGARAARAGRRSSWPGGATGAARRSRAPRTRRARSPARSTARSRSIYGGGAPRRRRGDALEVRRQRERQGARVLGRAPGARPQRDLRLRPARRRHPAGASRSSSCGTRRSTSGSRPASTTRARSLEECVASVLRCRPRGRGGSRSCSTSCTSATGRAATSRSTTTWTPARSTRSPRLKAALS